MILTFLLFFLERTTDNQYTEIFSKSREKLDESLKEHFSSLDIEQTNLCDIRYSHAGGYEVKCLPGLPEVSQKPAAPVYLKMVAERFSELLVSL
jgi:hypothetical protein